MEGFLDDYISKNCSSGPLKRLPLMHSCQGYDAVLIMRENTLKATRCKVFNQDLLYFFYGKPSYPASGKVDFYTGSSMHCPVCFIVNPKIVNPNRVFPFDSGAYKSGRYDKIINKKIAIDTYIISEGYKGIQKYISTIYGSNENYINGDVVENLPECDHIEIPALIKLLKSDDVNEYDERANTIEIISNESYKLSEIVEYVILPYALLKDASVKNWLIDNKIKYETYRSRKLSAPNRFDEVVFQRVLSYLIKEGYIIE